MKTVKQLNAINKLVVVLARIFHQLGGEILYNPC